MMGAKSRRFLQQLDGRRCFNALALAVAVAVGACAAEQPELDLQSISPARVFAGRRTPILLEGSFYAPVGVDLSTGRHELDDSFIVTAGGEELTSPLLLSEDALSAVVPPWLPMGIFDISVLDPLDREVGLLAALEVLPPDNWAPLVEIVSPEDAIHVLAGESFLVQFRATEFDPALIVRVEWSVAGAASDSGVIEPTEPSSSVTGSFPVDVPPNPAFQRVVIEVVAHDDSPAQNEGRDRIEIFVDICTSHSECMNDSVCDGRELCVRGVCIEGEPPSCNDGLACTLDRCDEAYGGCVHETRHLLCDDGLFCTGRERCDEEAGCVLGTPPCDDDIDCTVDYCAEPPEQGEPGVCWSAPAHDRCQDGVYCNGAEICDPDVGCLSGPEPCANPHECSSETCDEVGMSCNVTLDHERCRDDLDCTTDRCDEEEGCINEVGVEGPAGDPTCVDGRDNDCDELVDLEDDGCSS